MTAQVYTKNTLTYRHFNENDVRTFKNFPNVKGFSRTEALKVKPKQLSNTPCTYKDRSQSCL